MSLKDPKTEMDSRFSSANAEPAAWSAARTQLERSNMYWLTTVRPDGRPHVTPLFGVSLDGAVYFVTGPDERKAKNLAKNAACVITIGCNNISGQDVIVEGNAERVRDEARLRQLAAAWAAKYADAEGAGLGDDWRFGVRDETFRGPGDTPGYVYEVRPRKAFGFAKGTTFSQTRWRF